MDRAAPLRRAEQLRQLDYQRLRRTGRMPPDFRLLRDRELHLRSPHLHQAGIGTLSQALVAGRPQLIVPVSFDQPDNAASPTYPDGTTVIQDDFNDGNPFNESDSMFLESLVVDPSVTGEGLAGSFTFVLGEEPS